MTTHKRSLSFLLILSALMAFTSLSTDIYLPAMPTMEKQLGGNAELTITGFLTGFAIAQLIWGPISDRIGRKLPLFIGMVLFVIGSVGCALSESMSAVVFWRIFQAVGACVGPMLSPRQLRPKPSGANALHAYHHHGNCTNCRTVYRRWFTEGGFVALDFLAVGDDWRIDVYRHF